MAAALKYEKVREMAPRVIAKGKGRQAERMLAIAREYDIPIIENKELLKILMQIDENELIPEIVYQTVAEIYAFILQLDENSASQ